MPQRSGVTSISKKAGRYERPKPLDDASNRSAAPPAPRVQRATGSARTIVTFQRVTFDTSEGLGNHFVIDENGNLLDAESGRPSGLTVVRLSAKRL